MTGIAKTPPAPGASQIPRRNSEAGKASVAPQASAPQDAQDGGAASPQPTPPPPSVPAPLRAGHDGNRPQPGPAIFCRERREGGDRSRRSCTAGPPRLQRRRQRRSQAVTARDGPHQADGSEIHRRQGAAEAARHQGGPEERALHGGRQETASLPARHGGAAGDPALPEIHGAADPEAAVPEARPRDRPGLQNRPALPERCHRRPAGGERGVPGGAVRGHEPVRHPRQARHHHAQGHPAGPADPRRARLRPRIRESRDPEFPEIPRLFGAVSSFFCTFGFPPGVFQVGFGEFSGVLGIPGFLHVVLGGGRGILGGSRGVVVTPSPSE